MPQTFDCPKCGAPVAFERSNDPHDTKTTVRCAYCHSQLIAPNELAGQPARVVRIQLGLSSGKAPKWLWVLLAIPLFILVIVGLAAVGVLAPAFYSVSRTVNQPPSNQPLGGKLPTRESPNSFANVLLEFGSEGIGPGMFTDAGGIPVNGAGGISVGEYTGGRIQVFDPAGKFVNQWSIGDRKTILRGLAADRKGTIYAVPGGGITRYNGETGEKIC